MEELKSYSLDDVIQGVVNDCYPVSNMMIFDLDENDKSYICDKLGIVSKLLIEVLVPLAEVVKNPVESLDDTDVKKSTYEYQARLIPVVVDLSLRKDETYTGNKETYIVHDYSLPIYSKLLSKYFDKLVSNRLIIESDNEVVERSCNA